MEENTSSKSKGISIALILLAIVIGFGFVIGLAQSKGAQNLNNTVTEISNYTFDENGNLLSYVGDMTEIVIPETYSLSNTSEQKIISSSSIYSVIDQARNLGLSEFTVKNESGNQTDDFGNVYYQEKYSIKYQVRKTIEGSDYQVTSIGSRAFQNNQKITSITIPNNVISLGDYCFYNCSKLTTVTLPEGVQSIDNNAFYNCRNLETINLPDSITLLGSSAFQNCDKLQNIELPNSIIEIHSSLFYDCDGLTEIVIPNSVRMIYGQAFQYCRNLQSITFGNNIQHIDSYAFNGCNQLTTIDIASDLNYIGYRAFYNCSSLQNVILRTNNYISLDNYAFPMSINKIYVSDLMFEQYLSDGMWVNYWDKLARISEMV